MMRTIFELTAILALCFISVSRAVEITHIEVDNAHLIDTGPLNYAILSPSLAAQNNWKTVSVNGDNAVIYSATCQQTLKSTQTLSESERALIVNTRAQIQSSESGVNINGHLNNRQVRRSSTKYSLDGSKIQVNNRGSNTGGSGMVIFNNNGRSISKNDDNNFSLSKQGLPNNLVRIFLNNDIATFVYSDGQVQMKPVACLQPAEQQLLQESRLEVQQAEEQFRHEMTDFQQNMRDNMQRLRDNLSNMFSANTFAPGYNMAHTTTYPNQFQPQPQQQQQQVYNPYVAPMGNFWGAGSAAFSSPSPFNTLPSTPQVYANSFPFGPNNNPFGAGFPFNG